MKRIVQTILIGALIAASLVSQAQDPKCKATTKKGTPCKNAPTVGEYCKIHDVTAPRCNAEKKTGGKCQMKVAKDGDRCRYHANK